MLHVTLQSQLICTTRPQWHTSAIPKTKASKSQKARAVPSQMGSSCFIDRLCAFIYEIMVEMTNRCSMIW